MDPIERWQYKLSLGLKVRNSAGTAFQDFFSTIMEKVHSNDFVRVRPFGSLGDKGCDGYLTSTGQVFQCFGKVDDAAVKVATLVEKIDSDYKLAAKHLQSIMKEWHFCHNLVNGLPIEAITTIEQMKLENPEHKFGVIGPAGLEAFVFMLEPADLLELLGPAATSVDTQNLRMEIVRDLVDMLMIGVTSPPPTSSAIAPVPTDKLEFNKLPHHWCGLITAASRNGSYVREYFDRHPAPEMGDAIATVFKDAYRELALEGLLPGTIMDCLYERITGIGSVSTERQVAAQTLLAYLFDACDIFEDHPSKVSA
jgi:hypothetical protein